MYVASPQCTKYPNAYQPLDLSRLCAPRGLSRFSSDDNGTVPLSPKALAQRDAQMCSVSDTRLLQATR
jgi:hypothetical protein